MLARGGGTILTINIVGKGRNVIGKSPSRPTFTIPLIILFMNNGNKREKNGSLNKAFCVIFKVSNFVFIEVL